MKSYILLFLFFSSSVLYSQDFSKDLEKLFFRYQNYNAMPHSNFFKLRYKKPRKKSNANEILSLIKKYKQIRYLNGQELPRKLKRLRKNLKELNYINSINRKRPYKIPKLGRKKISYHKNRVSRIANLDLKYSYYNSITRIADIKIKYLHGKIIQIDRLKIKYRYGKIYKIGEYRLR